MREKKNIIILIIAIVIFIIALVFCIYTFKNNISKNEKEEILEEVSKTKDIEDSEYKEITIYREDGSEVKLSDFKDKPVMLLFWNRDNEDSMTVLKKVNELYERYNSKITFLMINTSQDVDEKIKDEVSIDIYYDFYKEAVRNYNIIELPSMIYITEDNQVFNAKAGLTTTDALEANLDILSNNI